MSPDSESLILQLLREMRAEIGDLRADIKDVREQMATKDDLRFEISSLRTDIASDLLITRTEMSEQIARLRREISGYHAAVIGTAF